MTYFGAPRGRKCNCGREASVVESPSVFWPVATLLCSECADGNREVKTMIYAGEIPLSTYEVGAKLGSEVARRTNEAVWNALMENRD